MLNFGGVVDFFRPCKAWKKKLVFAPRKSGLVICWCRRSHRLTCGDFVEFPVGTSPRAHGGGCEGITPKCPQIPWDGGIYPKWGEEEAILYDFVHRAWWKMIPFNKKSPCPWQTFIFVKDLEKKELSWSWLWSDVSPWLTTLSTVRGI